MGPVVIVGSGLAGITLLREFRKLDKSTPVKVVSADDGGFYAKPNLSNALALKREVAQLVQASAPRLAEQLDAEFLTHTQVHAVHPEHHVLHSSAGELAYEKLVLAIGAKPICLNIQGDAPAAVLSVNSLTDYVRFRDRLVGKRRVAILGAGLIGCEFANDLSGAGYQVEVFDPSTHPLGRLLPTQAGSFLRDRLGHIGIRFHFGRTIAQINAEGAGYSLIDDQGTTHHADLVLSAVGLRASTELASAAGLKTGRGIVADQYLQTSIDGVYALGDCAEIHGQLLPFVLPIMHGARALAKTLSGEMTALSYPVMPVVVKIPACPTVISPPAPGVSGTWQESETADGWQALFRDAAGRLHGFALVGAEAVKAKTSLVEQIVGGAEAT
ncbi:Rubredoxin-NAD(+) reductase [Ferriphaselus amnicola]|uniref:Rubredoxin-NAD(+) reductase n=1 Tax=Ferriphaselus amnicola TaxID=1188319 RepID=A0A2Z6G8I6_9PROT|nr:FAD-dependent oxidoreductase [Ferriphaselus amnicola]BBE49715.1 Rubredoxin-NAD(+) reductase [Ferriphaselus amnicola]